MIINNDICLNGQYFYSLLINTRIYYDDVSNDDKQRYTSTKKVQK